ncbi:hypothetical protein [Streptomyces sp. NPDC008137]|uniref:hypothetical protein n=1 Tax=Streptomyces sp. NPDC008137 TaxID=3364813 RepID=UPI0036E0B448
MTSDRHLALMGLMNEIIAPSRTYQQCVRRASAASSISPQYDAAVKRGNAALDDIEEAVRRWVAKYPAPVADAPDPTPLRWGLNDVMWGDDDTVTVLLSGPDGEPYWLELDPERAAVLRQDLAGPQDEERADTEEQPAPRTQQCGHDDYHDPHEWADQPHVWCPGHSLDADEAQP